MEDTEILNKLIERLIDNNICPDDIGLKDRADEYGEDSCKKKYCSGCWNKALKTIDK